MNKLAQQLIKLGHTNPELRPDIRPVLDKIAGSERNASPNVEIQRLIDDADNASDRGDREEARRCLDRAFEVADTTRKPALMRLVHRAQSRILDRGKAASRGSVSGYLRTLENMADDAFRIGMDVMDTRNNLRDLHQEITYYKKDAEKVLRDFLGDPQDYEPAMYRAYQDYLSGLEGIKNIIKDLMRSGSSRDREDAVTMIGKAYVPNLESALKKIKRLV